MQRICLPNDPPLSVEDGGEWWIAFYGDEPVGFGAIKPSVRWPSTGYLSRAGVIPEHRGNGLQRKLIRTRLKWARLQGWQWAITDNIEGNSESANNIAASGFRLYDPAIAWGSAGALYWRKYIAVAGKETKSEMPQ